MKFGLKASVGSMCMPAVMRQSVLVVSLLWALDHGAYASFQARHLRSGRQPTLNVDISKISFDKLDLNKDGKIDAQEFMAAQRAAAASQGKVVAMKVDSANPGVPAGMAPVRAAAPPTIAATAVAPAPAAVAAEDLPEHLRPPPLPSNIPEPPPPPLVPPAEPHPPPFPPEEGQMVVPPPSQAKLVAAGNLTQLMTEGVPGLDLDGTSPLLAPNTPPPVPVPQFPPDLPKTIPSQKPVPRLDPALMTPAPHAFGIDVGRTVMVASTGGGPPTIVSTPTIVSMPALPQFPSMNENPRSVLLTLASRRVHVSSVRADHVAPINPPGVPPPLRPAPRGGQIAVTSTTLPEGAGGVWRVGRPSIPALMHGVSPNNFAAPLAYVEPTTSIIPVQVQPGAPAPAPFVWEAVNVTASF